ncbi:LapA family protein [Actinokineospora sp. HUAS TT18]|uniref:LapA family protein n=1 Tax=Actinokineospora sp. HUAS TT18 TaxID=3447451 RepID=UPI003F51C6BF
MPRTRTGTAWAAISAGTLISIALIIFLVQNTRTTEINFLWMTTSTSLAVALLIAAVGSVLLTLIIGTARITQLRRLVRGRTVKPTRQR